uniref:Extracellular solute-binding protein family 1 n=1 Tax=uncultured bacterium Contig29 TaxID=1393550 RepID=W0FNM4_9BACT|nr:extracellular solute-binding protein family 1 [uncultured bacterium Contig29]
MKKLVSLFLVLALALGMMSFASAEDGWVTLRVETYDRDTPGFDVTDCWQLKYAQENFGDPNKIKLEFISYARWTENELLVNDMAGGTAPDLCMTYNAPVQQFINDGGLRPLDDLLNEYGPDLKAFIGEELLSYGQSDQDGDGVKEQWFIPARRMSVANVGNFIRKDWLEKLNMEKPTNIAELTEYLRQAKAQNLGGENTIPFSFGIFAQDPMFNVRRITDAFVDFNQVTEEDWFALAHNPEMLPGAREGFRWLNTLYHEELLPEGFATNDDLATDTALTQGYTGFFSQQPDQPWRDDKNYEVELEKAVPGASWETVNPFLNESLGKHLHDVYSANGLSIIIPKTTSDEAAVAAMKYLNWMAIPENMFMLQNGIEGINYGRLTEDGIPTDVVNTENVPNDHKMHAGDICFIANGLCFFDDVKNAAALALKFTGYEDEVRDSYVDAMTDTWTQIAFTTEVEAATDYDATVKSKQAEFIAAVISCDADQFDAVFDAGIEEIKTVGATEMIEGFRAAYQAGTYRGTFPGAK